MEQEPECGVCGTRGTHGVGAETAAPAVGCRCGVIVTGFTEGEATERWEILARRAEVGRLVEALMESTDRGVVVAPHNDDTGAHVGFEAWTLGRYMVPAMTGSSILEALRALAAKMSPDA